MASHIKYLCPYKLITIRKENIAQEAKKDVVTDCDSSWGNSGLLGR